MKNKFASNTPDINVVWMTAVSIVFLVIFLTALIRPLIMRENAYHRVEGQIVGSFQGGVRLNTSQNFYNINGRDNNTFKEKVPIGGNAIIWYKRVSYYRTPSSLMIKKMIVNDEVIIPLNKRIGVNVILVCIAALFSILGVIEILKPSEKGEN
ncbi:MAG: hypothetical protein FWD82_08195 [Defluviitaleaceae bacterium]|nr:hypothetical protein [Defluviitaleaceae bacterium]